MRLTREECEKLLEHMAIKGVVQGRTKKNDSLEEKLKDLEMGRTKKNDPLEKMMEDLRIDLNEDLVSLEMEDLKTDLNECLVSLEKKMEDLNIDLNEDPDNEDPDDPPNLKDWVSKGKEIYQHPEMGDLAGVRIGLYFPGDIPKVAQKIEEHFDRKWLFGTVTGGRDTTQGRNVHIQKHQNGPWFSPGPDGTAEHWEHYGYKSWQIVVEWKWPLPKPIKSLRERMPAGRKSLRVEIQVGTVVTQAWAEVQHNIIYKNPTDILATPTMKRIIDAINGLAITTDIMLEELDRCQKVANEEAEKIQMKREEAGVRRFKTIHDLLEGLHRSHIPMQMGEGYADLADNQKTWSKSLREAELMLDMCSQPSQPGPRPRLTKADFEKLIPAFYLMTRSHPPDADMSLEDTKSDLSSLLSD